MKLELRVDMLSVLENGYVYVSASSIDHSVRFTVPSCETEYSLGDLLDVTVEHRVSNEEMDALVCESVLQETLQTLKRSLSPARYEALIAELGDDV